MTESLLASILGLDLTDFLLHLLNFLILVGGIGLLVYKPVIRFVHARREEVEKQENEHNAKMQEAESTKAKYTALIGTAEQEIAEKKKEMEKQTAVAAEKTLTEARVRAEKIVKEAEDEAKNEKAKAMSSMKGEVAEVAVLIASEILKKEISKEENDQLIDNCLKEWENDDD
ncbi:MAG: ATP synthase F0 subunit B [Christensenellaceae bacterium]|jgi:ATP synthase subunit b